MRCLPPQALTVTFICDSRPDGARESLKRVSHRSGDTQAHLRQNDSHHMRRASPSCLLYLLKPYRTGSFSPCSPACSSSSSSKTTGTSGLSHQILLTVIPSSVAECCLVWLISHPLPSFSHPLSSFLLLSSSPLLFLLLPPLPPCFQCCANRSDALRSLATFRVSLNTSPAARFKSKWWLCSLFCAFPSPLIAHQLHDIGQCKSKHRVRGWLIGK